MKTQLLLLCVFLSACSTPGTSVKQTEVAEVEEDAEEEEESEAGATPPRLGMTRQQVRDLYGRPMNVSMTPKGEVWTYFFNNFDGRAFIPVYGAVHQAMKKRHHGTIFFDQNGRVKDYNWSESNPWGASVWR